MATSLIERAKAYVAKMEDANEGQRGSWVTFEVALRLVHFFELSDEDALVVLQDYNATKCHPAWSEKELKYKIRSARKSRWKGKTARDLDREAGHRQGGKSTPAKAEARTPRMGFVQCRPPVRRQTEQSRILRTDFLNKFNVCAQAHTQEAGGACAEKPSEVSESVKAPEPVQAPTPEKRNETLIDDPDLEGVQWRGARMEHGHDFRTKFTRWVAADGAVHHAHVSDQDGQRLIRIGREIGRVGDLDR